MYNINKEVIDQVVKKNDPDYKNTTDIKWNFTKFLVDREGVVVARFESTVKPEKNRKRDNKIIIRRV